MSSRYIRSFTAKNLSAVVLLIPNAATAQEASDQIVSAPSQTATEASPSISQPTQSNDEQTPAADIVVTGIRRSIQQSLNIKRNAVGVVDAISAEDIGKLPDQNIAESISRIPGVQITRRDGEGNSFTIRGLSGNRVEINGRAYTGPNQNATPNLQTLNPEILAGVEVIKSPSADRIEGAQGGLVNLKTRRPLDMPGDFVGSGRIQGLYGDLLRHVTASGSGLLSKKFADGRFGILAAVAYGRVDGSAQGFATGGYRETSPNSGIFQPSRLVSQIEARDQRRFTANAAMQWKPDGDTDIVLEGTYSKFVANRDLNYFQTLLTPNSGLGQSATLSNPIVAADGTLVKATFNNVTVRPLVYFARTAFESLNIGGTAKHSYGALTVVVDGSYSKGSGTDGNSGSPFTFVVANSRGNRANVSYDLTSSRIQPNYTISTNYNINDPQQYQLVSLYDGSGDSNNDGYDGKIDLQYDLDNGFVRLLKAGVRYENIHLFAESPQFTPGVNAAILAVADTNKDGVIRPNELSALNYNYQYSGNYLPGVTGSFPRNFPTGVVDPVIGRQNLGFGPPPSAPLTIRDVTQRTWAAYAMANLEGTILGKTSRLNIGGRYVVTRRTSNGFAGTSNSGPVTPISFESTFRNFLPSANFSLDITNNFIFRLSAAKVLSRPDLLLVGTGLSINPVNLTASTGNPNLTPFKATQEDATLEWYPAAASIVSVAVFNKNINSFTVPLTTQLVVPVVGVPTTVTLSQPTNGGQGTVRGFEFGLQQTLRFLPGFLSNFGVQANYTFADSQTPVADPLNPATTLPLIGLSRNSYNLIGYYEDTRFNARIAYVYRDHFLNGVQARALGGSTYTDSLGQLDASASLNITDRVQLVIDSTALNRPVTREYTGTITRTDLTVINDRRFSIGFAAKF